METLIKKQDEEFDKKFSNIAIVESWGMQLCKCGKEPCECEKIVKDFIAKIRKETAEAVCDKMIEEISDLRKAEYSDREEEMWDYGYDTRIKEEKEIKQQILKELL